MFYYRILHTVYAFLAAWAASKGTAFRGSAPISRESGSTHKHFNIDVKGYPLDGMDRLAR
jgi:hypothetical protein